MTPEQKAKIKELLLKISANQPGHQRTITQWKNALQECAILEMFGTVFETSELFEVFRELEVTTGLISHTTENKTIYLYKVESETKCVD